MAIMEASLTGVLRMILIVLAIYFLVRFLGRLLMPFMNGNSGPNRRGGQNRPKSDNRKEGEVRIEYTDKVKKRQSKDSGEGDYIDFEEMD